MRNTYDASLWTGDVDGYIQDHKNKLNTIVNFFSGASRSLGYFLKPLSNPEHPDLKHTSTIDPQSWTGELDHHILSGLDTKTIDEISRKPEPH